MVVVAVALTTSEVLPDDGSKVVSPEYEPSTGSVPVGALVAEHEPVAVVPDPADSVAVHMAVEPMVNLTVPVGTDVPPDGVTVAA